MSLLEELPSCHAATKLNLAMMLDELKGMRGRLKTLGAVVLKEEETGDQFQVGNSIGCTHQHNGVDIVCRAGTKLATPVLP